MVVFLIWALFDPFNKKILYYADKRILSSEWILIHISGEAGFCAFGHVFKGLWKGPDWIIFFRGKLWYLESQVK